MRRLTLASTGFVALMSGSAWAADMGANLPMTAPGFDWAGYYAGMQAGYGWGRSDITVGGDSVKPDIGGGFVGGHVAGLWQFDQAVLGAEADLNYASIDGTADAGPANTFGTDIKWFGSVNAKAGYAMDRMLIYGIGGIAFAGTETSQTAGAAFARTRTSTGWTLGAGVDYALTNNVVVGAQYRYYDFGKEHFDAADTFSERDQDVKLQTLGVNFSYKF